MTETYAPGSRMATAARNDQDQAEVAFAAEGSSSNMTPVPVQGTVRVATAEDAVYRTLVLQPSAYRQLVPQDPDRYSFYVLAVDQPVILCSTKDLASSPDNQTANIPYPTGFYLPTALPVLFRSKGLVWAVNTSSSSAARVSVVVERYEKP